MQIVTHVCLLSPTNTDERRLAWKHEDEQRKVINERIKQFTTGTITCEELAVAAINQVLSNPCPCQVKEVLAKIEGRT